MNCFPTLQYIPCTHTHTHTHTHRLASSGRHLTSAAEPQSQSAHPHPRYETGTCYWTSWEHQTQHQAPPKHHRHHTAPPASALRTELPTRAIPFWATASSPQTLLYRRTRRTSTHSPLSTAHHLTVFSTPEPLFLFIFLPTGPAATHHIPVPHLALARIISRQT